ncbi:unnamed protein product [Spirodela intermedia]|uniref:Uncharacterized protein n=1 Tax=Spirodela intermedia TaxID=51605 RepID=A0A7I8L4R5_SPIIN|nr:unnamed protein product [Spirodela intermedia]
MGASHNYICRQLTARLQLPMTGTQSYHITLNDNRTTFDDRVCCDYNHFSLLKYPFLTVDMIVIFIQDIVHLYDFSLSIVTDEGSVFSNALWRELHLLQGTLLIMSYAYHSKTND